MLRLQRLLFQSRQGFKSGQHLESCLYWSLNKGHRPLSVSQRFNSSPIRPSTSVVETQTAPIVKIEKIIETRRPSETRVRQEFIVGKVVEGFEVRQVSKVPDFHLTAVRLRHATTGAEYLHIDRDDSNNVFSVGFRTTPTDSTGLPHILEHITLCGSDKYPCRDPFFKMLNRSMATFMNAMTGPDCTMYPFSTQNPRDYENLMSVYLDAVFKPKLKETDFKQEGWRLEHTDINDPTSSIVFKGVVFNEMKGVFSENQALFGQQLLNSILPSHTYGNVSGGDPLCIPSLTYKDLKAFHARYYNAANAHIYSYGNFPLTEHLEYVNQTYLSDSNVSPKDGRKSAVPPEKRWTEERSKHIACRPDSMAADANKQSSLAIGYLCSDINDVEETFVLQVISELLVKGPNSAFYKSLVEPNIGAGLSPVTGYDAQTRDTIFAVGLQGLNPSDFGKVIEIIDMTFDTVIQKGFEEKHIEGILHGIELNVKHQSTDFGLGLLFGLTPLWNHGGDLVKALNIGEQVSSFRKNLKHNPRFLQDKVAHHFKSNRHRLVLTMSPEEGYEEKQADVESKLLAQKISQLTPFDKETIFKEGIELMQLQQKSEDTSCLPTLKTADLKKELDRTLTKETVLASVPIQVCPQPTNGITYFRGVLNTANLGDDLKMLLPLFTQVAAKMGTTNHDYCAFDQLIHLKTGGLGISNHIAEDLDYVGKYEEGVIFSTYCLDRNVEDMFRIWGDLFRNVTLKDMKRFDTLTRVLAANLINGIADMGHHYAMSSSASLINASSRRKELIGGLSYIKKMRHIAQMKDLSPILANMQTISTEIFNKKHLRCALNLCPENMDNVLTKADDFIAELPGLGGQSFQKTDGSDKIGLTKSLHHIHPIPVNFAAKSISTVTYRHPHYAPLMILSRLLTSKYLHPNVREKGGAYGSGVSLSSAGVLSFYSYRDPNSTTTFDIFDKSVDWVLKNDFSEQDIEEAKIGVFQNVDAPVPPGSKGLANFLYGMDDETRQNHRLALMKVVRENILEVAMEYLTEGKHNTGRALIGPENKDLSRRTREKWETIIQEQ